MLRWRLILEYPSSINLVAICLKNTVIIITVETENHLYIMRYSSFNCDI